MGFPASFPGFAKWLFGSSAAGWIWLGWEWLQAGWSNVSFLEWVRDSGHTVLGPVVAVGEVIIGIALILGLCTGIMAFLGAILNFSFVFAGSAGVNPAMTLVAGLLIAVAGDGGGVPCHRLGDLHRSGLVGDGGCDHGGGIHGRRGPLVGGGRARQRAGRDAGQRHAGLGRPHPGMERPDRADHLTERGGGIETRRGAGPRWRRPPGWARITTPMNVAPLIIAGMPTRRVHP